MHEPLNLKDLYEVRYTLSEVERDLKILEEDESIEFKFVVVAEMIDLDYRECIFRNTKEFNNEETAREYYIEEVNSVKRSFVDMVELVEHEDIFHIANAAEEINIILYKVVE